MNVHEVWVITSRKGTVCYTKEGQMCCYTDQRAGTLAMAEYMNKHPEKEFKLRKTKLQLPWL